VISNSRRNLVRARLIASALLLPAVLAACGSDTDVQTTAAPSGTREVTHAAGTTEIPADPQRIVTTTDQNALLPLLELGVRPVGSAGLLGDDGSQTFRRTEGFDTSGVEFTGAYGEPNVEKVLTLDPDLIVGYEFDEEYYDDLSRAAPTVLVQIFDRPLSEALLEFGDVVNRQDEAEVLQATYDGRVAALQEKLGDRLDSLSVSVLSAGDPGTFTRFDVGQAVGTVADDVGLLRVPEQQADTGEQGQSLEQLPGRSADVVLVVDFAGDSGEVDPGLQALLDSPLYRSLPAVQAGQAHVFDGTKTVGAAWARMDAFLDVLEKRVVDARDDVVLEP